MANEKRLIDANAFCKSTAFICGGKALDPYWNGYADALDRVEEVLEQQPTVDAVEVVRCKDCKHRSDALDCGNYLCNRKMLGMVRPNDFCSFGERKDNG